MSPTFDNVGRKDKAIVYTAWALEEPDKTLRKGIYFKSRLKAREAAEEDLAFTDDIARPVKVRVRVERVMPRRHR